MEVVDIAKKESNEDAEYLDKLKNILCTRGGMSHTPGPAMLLDHLYLSNMEEARNYTLLKRHHITHVLNVAGKPKVVSMDDPPDEEKPKCGPYDPTKCEVVAYEEIEALDTETYPILMHYGKARRFIDEALDAKGRALVHCEMGVNRSAALCIAYMMDHSGLTLVQCIRQIKIDRPVLLTNEGFRKKLIQFARERGLMFKKKKPT